MGLALTSNRTPVKELEFTRDGTYSKPGTTKIDPSYSVRSIPAECYITMK